ncbi:MAG: hypothetical protein AVDCRST_MAG85-372 [uncultured Solirubrobacteraceae bacterium]|uniref:Uncharacterized protein n=1 Tax=uncultured Solirubrobacteraceae bacterium TaxID=1162706 RepID=A0A6J4RT42_9ACTN|nr:MAG: hypothetical protein AVDCRST_MAG85-372 [uncultured Solirubrobacteraceae bacterium]
MHSLTFHAALTFVGGGSEEASGLAIAAFVVFALLLAVTIGLLWRLADRRRADRPTGERGRAGRGGSRSCSR